MKQTAKSLLENTQGAVAAYVGSDEITLVLLDLENIVPKGYGKPLNPVATAWNGRVEKLLSITASMATRFFNMYWYHYFEDVDLYEENDDYYRAVKENLFKAEFDCKVFQPVSEIYNELFIDTFDKSEEDLLLSMQAIYSRIVSVRENSIQMLARVHYTQGKLNNKNTDEMLMMLADKNIDWETLVKFDNRYGTVYYRKWVDKKSYNPKTKEEVVVNRRTIVEATPELLKNFYDSKSPRQLLDSELTKAILESKNPN